MNKFLNAFLFLSMVTGAAQGAGDGLWAKITRNRWNLFYGASIGSSVALSGIALREGCPKEEIAVVAGAALFMSIFPAMHTAGYCDEMSHIKIEKIQNQPRCQHDEVKQADVQKIAKIKADCSREVKGWERFALNSAAICVPLSLGLYVHYKTKK